MPSYPPVECGGDPTVLLKPIQQGSQCSTASGALSSTHQHPTWLVSRRARTLLSHATRTLATGRVRQRRLHTGNNPRPCGRARSSPARRVIPCAGHWRGRFDADIATKQERPSVETVEVGVLMRFASMKILVWKQWEAVRFDRVKHTADTLRAVFSAGPSDSLEQQRRGARAPGAIGLSGATTLRAAAD